MSGKDQEDAYFYKINRELIDQRRSLIDQKKSEDQMIKAEKSSWICPKCGGQMSEGFVSNIIVERCNQCHGIFFDAEEFLTFTQAKEHKSFLEQLFDPNRNTFDF